MGPKLRVPERQRRGLGGAVTPLQPLLLRDCDKPKRTYRKHEELLVSPQLRRELGEEFCCSGSIRGEARDGGNQGDVGGRDR